MNRPDAVTRIIREEAARHDVPIHAIMGPSRSPDILAARWAAVQRAHAEVRTCNIPPTYREVSDWFGLSLDGVRYIVNPAYRESLKVRTHKYAAARKAAK